MFVVAFILSFHIYQDLIKAYTLWMHFYISQEKDVFDEDDTIVHTE